MKQRKLWPCRSCRRITEHHCLRCGAPLCNRCFANGARHGKAKSVAARPNNMGITWETRWTECTGAAMMVMGR